MSNCFSCNFSGDGDSFIHGIVLNPQFLGNDRLDIRAYYFFYCAQPNATSASIQNVKTNLREYYVKHLKLTYRFASIAGHSENKPSYMMLFVLNVPQDYVPETARKLSQLPNHTIPENVLYYDLVVLDSYLGGQSRTKDISIDIKKPFRVSPSYKLAFVCYFFGGSGYTSYKEGSAQVFFAVN